MASKEGYALSKEGLSDMLKDQQRGFLQAYDGCEGLCKALGSDTRFCSVSGPTLALRTTAPFARSNRAVQPS